MIYSLLTLATVLFFSDPKFLTRLMLFFEALLLLKLIFAVLIFPVSYAPFKTLLSVHPIC